MTCGREELRDTGPARWRVRKNSYLISSTGLDLPPPKTLGVATMVVVGDFPGQSPGWLLRDLVGMDQQQLRGGWRAEIDGEEELSSVSAEWLRDDRRNHATVGDTAGAHCSRRCRSPETGTPSAGSCDGGGVQYDRTWWVWEGLRDKAGMPIAVTHGRVWAGDVICQVNRAAGSTLDAREPGGAVQGCAVRAAGVSKCAGCRPSSKPGDDGHPENTRE